MGSEMCIRDSFQELQEIFEGDGALLSTAGLNGGSCWNPTGPGLTAGLAAFASTPCMPPRSSWRLCKMRRTLVAQDGSLWF